MDSSLCNLCEIWMLLVARVVGSLPSLACGLCHNGKEHELDGMWTIFVHSLVMMNNLQFTSKRYSMLYVMEAVYPMLPCGVTHSSNLVLRSYPVAVTPPCGTMQLPACQHLDVHSKPLNKVLY